jgi:hypothetical protein
MSYWVSNANLICGCTPVHGICYKWKDVNRTIGNVSTNNSKRIFYFPLMGLATGHGKVQEAVDCSTLI